METQEERFEPLATEVNPAPVVSSGELRSAGSAILPRCLGNLVRARERFRRTLLLAAVLLVLSALELTILILMPSPVPLVVWEERATATLVRMP
jgi:hypothetical protein